MQQSRIARGIAAGTLVTGAILLSGCAGMTLEAREILQRPSSCEQAQADMGYLKASRANPGGRSTAEQSGDNRDHG